MKKAIQSTVTLVAVGDLHACRNSPETYFQQSRDIIKDADVAFGQFEGAISNAVSDVYSPQPRICCWQTKMATVLSDCGFDILSLASNHAMDGASQGLLDTLQLFERNRIKTVGAGATLEKARSAVILESKGSQIAFLSACSVMPVGYEAEDNRPGVAPLHAHTYYEQVDYQPGTPPLVKTICDEDDLQALVSSVQAVRPEAHVVVVSLHFGVHHVPEYIAGYQQEIAHAVIDAGADLVLGHHPHILKGIEVYGGKVIFYSLGNFAMDTAGCQKPPTHWFYRAKSRGTVLNDYPWYFRNSTESTTLVGEKELREDKVTLMNPDARKTIVAKVVIRANEIERVSFLPAIITNHIPTILVRQDPQAQEVLGYMERISRSQGLKATFTWDGDEVCVTTA